MIRALSLDEGFSSAWERRELSCGRPPPCKASRVRPWPKSEALSAHVKRPDVDSIGRSNAIGEDARHSIQTVNARACPMGVASATTGSDVQGFGSFVVPTLSVGPGRDAVGFAGSFVLEASLASIHAHQREQRRRPIQSRASRLSALLNLEAGTTPYPDQSTRLSGTIT